MREKRFGDKKTGEQICHNVCHLFHINTAEHKEKENNQEEQNRLKSFVTNICVIFMSH